MVISTGTSFIFIQPLFRCNAKFLWKRIPQNIITGNPDISAVWAVSQKLWKKDLPGTYQALAAYNWVEPIAPIIRALEGNLLFALNLISTIRSGYKGCKATMEYLRQSKNSHH